MCAPKGLLFLVTLKSDALHWAYALKICYLIIHDFGQKAKAHLHSRDYFLFCPEKAQIFSYFVCFFKNFTKILSGCTKQAAFTRRSLRNVSP